MKKNVVKFIVSLFLACCVLGMSACMEVEMPEGLKQKLCEHVYDETEVLSEATCTEKGKVLKICSDCGKSKTETVKALGHLRATDAAVAGTCQEPGLSAGSHCGRCGEVLVTQVEVMGPHSYTSNRVCSLCHDGMVEMTIEEGELVAGNWYRLYRDGVDNAISLSDSGDFFSDGDIYAVNSPEVDSQIYLTSSNGYCYVEGWNVVFTETYIDIYFELGEYPVYYCADNSATGYVISINAASAIDSCTTGCYRLVTETDTSTSAFEEVAITENETVAGNWYRIYRSSLVSSLSISHTGTLPSTGYFYASEADTTSTNYYLYVPDNCYWEGLHVIFTDDYIDIYFEAGTYNVVVGYNNTIAGTAVIDETTMILSSGPNVYRLVVNV